MAALNEEIFGFRPKNTLRSDRKSLQKDSNNSYVPKQICFDAFSSILYILQRQNAEFFT